MADESDIAKQLEQADAELAKLVERWKEAKLPPINDIWVFGPNAFPHHVDVLTCIKLLEALVGEDTVNLVRKEVQIEEINKGLEEATKMRSEMRRAALVQGVNVGIPKI